MFRSDKPYTAVTAQIENLTSEQYEIDDPDGIVALIEVVQLQATGPTEASRALRKKLKYGNLHRQLRALTILDLLIQNAGDRFLRGFSDEPLLERLRIAATDPVSDPELRKKCQELFGQWAATYKDTQGMGGITTLYKQLPKRKQPAQQAQEKVLRETVASPVDTPLGHSVSVSIGEGPSTLLGSAKPKRAKNSSSTFSPSSSKSSKRFSFKPFNMEKEKPEILQTIASASVASTNLQNALKLVNRETSRVSEDEEVRTQFEKCKSLRRQVLRYIQNIESGDLLGSLIHANEELVIGLMAFEVLDKSLDYDSDSEDGQGPLYLGGRNEGFSGITIGPPKPPRPARPTSLPAFPANGKSPVNLNDLESASESEEEDENNPFGDRNEIPA